MYRLKSYVELLLLVSIFPIAMPQIRNLSPLRGILNTDLPDSFRTTNVSTITSAGVEVGDRVIPFSNIALATSSSFGGSSGGLGDGGAAAGGLGGRDRVRPQGQTPPLAAAQPSFGASGSQPSFGSSGSQPSFGTSGSQPSFGSSGSQPSFGTSGSQPSFGTSSSQPSFGTSGFETSGSQPSFGTSGFGASGAQPSQEQRPQEQRPQEQRPPFPSSGAAGSAASGASGGFPGGSFEDAGELEGISLAHFGFRLPKSATVRESINMGRPMEEASINVVQMKKLNCAEFFMMLPNITMEDYSCPNNSCPRLMAPLCHPYAHYRTINGSCNNLRNPEWGTSIRRFNRYLHPDYEDCISKMRGEDRAIPLPNARTVSSRLQKISQKPSRKDLTMLVMQWGQFLDHDLTHTPETPRMPKLPPKSPCDDSPPLPILCCERGVPGRTSYDNCDDPGSDKCSCRPIDVSNDKLHRDQNRTCMRFVRSEVASKGCSLGPREQVNQVTSYLDASQVYGSDNKEAKGLRAGHGGYLRDSQPPSVSHGTFLPRMNCMESSNNEKNCFEAGDVRVNEQPALTSMHTLWLRVHNNIARNLKSLNPSWSDQRLYQETRRIVAALHQQITYREFLPIVHGPDISKEFHLNLQDQGYDNSYDSSVDATIVNVFATAAFRFGHTLIAESFKGMGHSVTFPLRGNFDEPLVLYNSSTSPSAILQGLTACPTRGSDAFFTPTLVNHLLSKRYDSVGFDLMALNIQRGRDHGLPPYHEWRRSCGLYPINFDNLSSIMDLEAAKVFQKSYKRVEDIDLFPAALAENTMPEGLLGPTFSCLLAQQFQALKIGDRFWYENKNQSNPFTPGQLSALREQSLASIMCQHLGLDSLQPMVFRSKRLKGNQLQYCSAFPRLNLSSWSQDPYNPPNPSNIYPNPNPKPRPTQPNRYHPKIPWCITQGTPKSHLDRFFPMCTPDLYIKNN